MAVTSFQSTHPRGVRPEERAQEAHHRRVSIHAPAWGATATPRQAVERTGVSIHAPAWGATVPFDTFFALTRKFQSTHPRGVRRRRHGHRSHEEKRFNPRTRVGCDAGHHQKAVVPGLVSIHAPAWGATPYSALMVGSTAAFQSTHPRGVRRGRHGRRFLPAARFNPRTRVGCDESRAETDVLAGQFQSTHPRGVRPARACAVCPRGAVSIHAPAWGATIRLRAHCLVSIGFNPRTRVGCDSARCRAGWTAWVSIHAPAWGATPGCCRGRARSGSFNPRTRVGCD